MDRTCGDASAQDRGQFGLGAWVMQIGFEDGTSGMDRRGGEVAEGTKGGISY